MALVRTIFLTDLPGVYGTGQNWTDLHFSVFFNDLTDVCRQIENGEDIDVRNGDGETPLHIACFAGDSRCIKTILSHNPLMNVAERTLGITPLILLVMYMKHRTRILKMMLDMGADPNLSQRDGNTPLHVIAKGGKIYRNRALRYALVLLKHKANVNSINKYGNTPLHTAIEKGFTEIIPIFLNYGASINIENTQGNDPLNIAYSCRNKFPGPWEQIGKYIIIQDSCKRQVQPGLVDEFCKTSSLKVFKEKCDEELSELKTRITDGTFVTYYDLLISPLAIAAKYLQNEDTLKSAMAFEKENLIFGGPLTQILRNAVKKNEATEIGYQFCKKFFPVILPELCLDQIFKYLTNEDLSQLKKFTSI